MRTAIRLRRPVDVSGAQAFLYRQPIIARNITGAITQFSVRQGPPRQRSSQVQHHLLTAAVSSPRRSGRPRLPNGKRGFGGDHRPSLSLTLTIGSYRRFGSQNPPLGSLRTKNAELGYGAEIAARIAKNCSKNSTPRKAGRRHGHILRPRKDVSVLPAECVPWRRPLYGGVEFFEQFFGDAGGDFGRRSPAQACLRTQRSRGGFANRSGDSSQS